MKRRCCWAEGNPIYENYHDNEWGIPQFDSKKLFEQLCLEGQQAGLSWIIVLKKREEYRKAFYYFDPESISKMTEQEIDELIENKNLIRHKAKLNSIIKNAKAYLTMEINGENFSKFIWSFVNHHPIINDVSTKESVPKQTTISLSISKALKKKGFNFVGATTCYAFMQACGLVDDHLNTCFCKNK